MFRSITNNVSKNLSAGGEISGDVTITGDLTVQGNGSGNYDEIVEGNLILTSGSKLGVGTGDVTLSKALTVIELLPVTDKSPVIVTSPVSSPPALKFFDTLFVIDLNILCLY